MQDGENQSSSDQEMMEQADQVGNEEVKEDASMASAKTSRRGRPRIPPKWSRIICFKDLDDYHVAEHEVEEDLQALQEQPLPASRARVKGWSLLFDQKEYWRSLEDRDLENHRLDLE